MVDVPPGHAFIAWAKSIPSVRCVAPAMEPWIHAGSHTAVAVTTTSRFDDTAVPVPLHELTTVASKGARFWYAGGSVRRRHAVVLHAGSEAEEWDFSAVLADAPSPPRALARLAAAPRLGVGIGLGTSRASVEGVLGHAKSTRVCGFDVVRYEPLRPVISEARMWFVYHHSIVVAFSRYVAV